MRLEGKKVIVTGANRSIRKAVALLFAKEGAELAISYRSDKKGAKGSLAALKKQVEKLRILRRFSSPEGVEQFVDDYCF